MSQLRIFNGYDCDLEYKNIETGDEFTVKSLEFYENKFVNITTNKQLLYNKTIHCYNYRETTKEKISFKEKQAISYFMVELSEFNRSILYVDDVAKSRSGFPKIRYKKNFYSEFVA